MEDYKLIGIQPEDIDKYWEMIMPNLLDVQEINDDTFSLDELFEELKCGASQLWIVAHDYEIKSVGVTKIIKRNGKWRLFFNSCAGEDIDCWVHLMHNIVAFAREKNCEEVNFTGRRGWKKVLADYGYRERATLFNLKLKDESNGNVIGI